MFGRRNPSPKDVREGNLYQREYDGRVVEIAKVVELYGDRAGVPHVRYELSYQRPTRADFEGLRVLALQSFVERYHAAAGE
ncbi:MAG: hypothetical protein ACE5LF_09850 [Alphaproteobacteria bacterium]